MGVLSGNEIERRLQLVPQEPDSLVVTPLSRRQSAGKTNRTGLPVGLDRDSLDLRLGTRFLLPRLHYLPFMHNTDADPLAIYKAVEHIYIPPDKEVIVPPHGTVLGATLIPSYEPRPGAARGSLRRTRSRGGSWLGCGVGAIGRLVVVGRRAVDRG